MIAPAMLLEILGRVAGRHHNFAEEGGLWNIEHVREVQELVVDMVGRHSSAEVQDGIMWLKKMEFLADWKAIGLLDATPATVQVTQKGFGVLRANRIPDNYLWDLLHNVEPYSVFVASQFNETDKGVVDYLTDDVLAAAGFVTHKGTAKGLEQFRESIVEKIRQCQFFVCLLSAKERIACDVLEKNCVSSVWLYQETGAAVAFGKQPLLLVEDCIHRDYVGQLQIGFEYVSWSRKSYATDLKAVWHRLASELERLGFPIPEKLSSRLKAGAGR